MKRTHTFAAAAALATTVVGAAAAILAAVSTAVSTTRHPTKTLLVLPGEPLTGTEDHKGRAADAVSGSGAKVSKVVGSGTMDGKAWSVTLEFYPKLPRGHVGPPSPSVAPNTAKSLLCQRTVIGGVLVDPWSGCQAVVGADDPGTPGAGLWGTTDKGLSGTRIFVGRPAHEVTHAAIALKGGQRLRAEVKSVPGTGYHAFAIPLGRGQTIASVDQYNARDQRLSHETDWR
jgi:hypothetical protein